MLVKWPAIIKLICFWSLLTFFIAWVETTGTVRGLVKDSTGAVLAGASIELKNKGTNELRSIQTNANGEFTFTFIPLGTYLLTVQVTGFQPQEQEFRVNLDETLQLQINLEVAQQQAEIRVIANDDAKVETVSTQLGNNMQSQTINKLPLSGRDVFKNLLQLQPGVMSSTGSSTFVGDEKNLSVNGSRGRANNYTVNGGDANDPAVNAPAVQPPPDAIEEFQVITNTFDAEYGRNSGSIINLVTKSGTNEFHGSVFEFFGNTKLNARGFFDPPKKPQFNSNIFGATLGGPIVKNQQFFFLSYQGTRIRQGKSTGPVQVPTPLERQGIFAPGSLSDEFPNGNISAMLDPLAVKLLQFVPLANVGDRTFFDAPVRKVRGDQVTLRYDYNINSNNRLTAYYYFDDNFIFEPISTFQNQNQTSVLPGFGEETDQRNQNINLSYTTIINSTTINEARFNFVRQAQGVFHRPVNRLDVTAFGFTGITPGLSGRTGIPYINVGGQFIIGNNFAADLPQFGNTFQVSDNFSKQITNHTVKFGGDYRRLQFNQIFFFAINGLFSFNSGSTDSTGNSLADFLLGRPDSYIQGSPGQLAIRAYSVNMYIQDSWRVRPNLTFNYGLRWQLDPPAIDLGNRIQAFRPGQQSQVFPTAPKGLVFPGDPGLPRGLADTFYKAFAPRLGLAFSPDFNNDFLKKLTGGTGKTSIRMAFGIAYNPVEQLVIQQFTGQPPFGGSSSSFSSTLADPFLLRDGSRLPNPFPVIPAKPGDLVDFTRFAPTVIFGQINPDLRPQYAIQYNLNIQRQIKNSLLVNLSYVGSQGHHLLATYDLNPGIASLCKGIPGCGPFGQDVAYPGFAGTRVFRDVNFDGNPFFSSIYTQDTISNSNYHALQVGLVKANTSGLGFEVAYTFSKSIDNASSFEQILNPFNFGLGRSLSQFDARHRLVFSYQYDIPFKRLFKNSSNRLLEGWSVSGITSFQSGFPIRLQDFTDASLTGTSGDFESTDTPDQIAPVRILEPRKNNLYFFDPSSFRTVPDNEFGRFGTASRQFFSGPGINNWDIAILKTTRLNDKQTLEFRLEGFNFFNHAQFLNPDGIITDGERFGRIFRVREPRSIQFALKLLF